MSHRDGGPAIEDDDAEQLEWFKNGKRHREDGLPAVECPDYRSWSIDGELHREGAPAVVHADGGREWFDHGRRHRTDGPAIERPYELPHGRKEWYAGGKLHRDGGPAVEDPEGTRFWYREGYLHNPDGPAIVKADGKERFFLNGDELARAIWMFRTGRRTRHGSSPPKSVSEAMRRR